MRNLLIFLLVLIGIWWLRRALKPPRRDTQGDAAQGAPGERDAGAPEQMLACAHCGVHVPESEGVRGGGKFYCCEEHRRLGASD